MKFNSSVMFNDPHVRVELTGVLDESAQLPEIARAVTGRLTIDFERVPMANSLGCRRWVLWVSEVARDAELVRLENCSPAIIQQINILDGFLPPRARVTSFFVPYECAACGHAARVHFDCENEFDPNVIADTLGCPTCGDVMSLEVLKSSYLKFLNVAAAS